VADAVRPPAEAAAARNRLIDATLRILRTSRKEGTITSEQRGARAEDPHCGRRPTNHEVGAVLDAGRGTGENALHIASLGVQVVGADVAESAQSIAREKAAARGIAADFVRADASRLSRLEQAFDTVLDLRAVPLVRQRRAA
jgi:2-polyprenyl-3-methyl-5-hydroxy-6-metoxy-1,4-benzoquinol methylase